MNKDYTDYLQTIDYADNDSSLNNQESSDEFYGCPEYKRYVEEWC